MDKVPFDPIGVASKYPVNVGNALLYLLFSDRIADRTFALSQAKAFIERELASPGTNPERPGVNPFDPVAEGYTGPIPSLSRSVEPALFGTLRLPMVGEIPGDPAICPPRIK